MSMIRAIFPELARAIKSIEDPFFHSVRRSSPFAVPLNRWDVNFPRLPTVDVVETDQEFKVYAEVPGTEKENIQIHAVNRNTLEIHGSVNKETMVPEPFSSSSFKKNKKQRQLEEEGEGKEEEGRVEAQEGSKDDQEKRSMVHQQPRHLRHRVLSQERFSQEFFRAVTFPQAIEPEKISAELKNGLLEVIIPKAKEENMSSIPIHIK
ncbi:hypothetical protein HMI54_002747 [Coelomomyces lativittatus]|nr:hypothetical protein HMI55_000533 [Coelomomyces lativittatus]KAJ1509137.1 hypothetical protein HMI56_006943 [Coelomomyces lativittatus]KAJ1518054.1 hypothetical protein HMI54_002747 [Coelomomyces lativittatus]